jgi:hypothetical protein
MFYQSYGLPKSCSTKVRKVDDDDHRLTSRCWQIQVLVNFNIFVVNRWLTLLAKIYMMCVVNRWLMLLANACIDLDSTRFRFTKVSPAEHWTRLDAAFMI